MTTEEAIEFVERINDRWRMGLDDEEKGLWMNALGQYETADVEEALAALDYMRERPRIMDFRRKLPLLDPADDDAEYVREPPLWAKAWLVARYRGDERLWPEQKQGYDSMQLDFPHTRTYVWSEAGELMPEEDRRRYETVAAKMTAEHFDALLTATVGAAR